MSMKIKEEDYVPQTKVVLYDLEVEMERIVLVHNEKLTVV
jgi:hypothetical protein